MKRIVATLAATVLACASVAAPAFGQNGNGNGKGGGSENSAADRAPGHTKGEGESAKDSAPGQVKGDDESAKAYAPGQTKRADDDDAPGVAKTNFGSLISTIRAGKSDLSGIKDDANVIVIDIDGFAANRTALDNALEAREAEIAQLREDLAALDLDGLTDAQIEAAVAVRVEADGTLTVFVD